MSELEQKVELWLKQLSQRERLRDAASLELSKLGPDDAAAVPALTTALDDEAFEHRAVVARVLGCIREEAAASIPALVRGLEGDDEPLARHCALALGRVGADTPEIIALLREQLTSESAFVRVAAASSLLLVAPSSEALELLREHRRREGTALHYWAATGLADAAKQGGDVLRAVVELLDDWDSSIQAYATIRMKDCDLAEVVPLLLEAVRGDDPLMVVGALRSLAELGASVAFAAVEIQATLIEAGVSEMDDSNVRRWADRVVLRVPLEGAAAKIAELTDRLEDPDYGTRGDAAQLLLSLESLPEETRKRAEEEFYG